MMAQSRANGSHYALTAIGLGMLVLGIIMAVWNLVPGFGPPEKPAHAGNSSKPDRGSGGILKSKTFSVAYVLVGAGLLLLLVSLCLNVRDKKRQSEEMAIAHVQRHVSVEPSQQEDSLNSLPSSQEEDEDVSSQYYVPSYEEVMNTGYSEPRDSDRSNRLSVSLPSYESLTGLDESSQAPGAPGAAGTEPGTERQPSRHSSRLSKRLKPLKVRRIKSEKLHLKDIRLNLDQGNSTVPVTIEPLTPPPKYEEIQEKAPVSQQMP
ncbi:transmembrane protein 51 isoform X1 [Manacus candei]|uniref:transmembrane protein 51 isoform X1 n=1 Tax=Manacus candei TaxID=415023 RepID=UPI002226FCE4|nr:transmembrane protein 51 isoform X1 [Manacus candei]XP_051642463.1 transmembrane protein 51 isoform X1 [Manacus candei]XP_051642464.1 transmembrane protein 51 isoform X1 [Manacus candei]XP_051642465.1 transmembrane protein 51 isoform X1 [Manacus candei]